MFQIISVNLTKKKLFSKLYRNAVKMTIGYAKPIKPLTDIYKNKISLNNLVIFDDNS